MSKQKSNKGNRQAKFNTAAYAKASRRGEWQAVNEDETGFTSVHSVHPTKKSYTRKDKHKKLFS